MFTHVKNMKQHNHLIDAKYNAPRAWDAQGLAAWLERQRNPEQPGPLQFELYVL